AHITGGGISENLPRVLNPGCHALIDLDAWELPAVFRWLQTAGGVAEAEMLRTFNCGIGMVAVVAAEDAEAALAQLREAGESPLLIGQITAGEPGVSYAGRL
ncbi:MAG: AIR synthase-related protein, partial [Candidatus Methylumidiphilus sp.]